MHIAYILFIHFPQLKFKYSPGIKNQINSCFYIFLDFLLYFFFLATVKILPWHRNRKGYIWKAEWGIGERNEGSDGNTGNQRRNAGNQGGNAGNQGDSLWKCSCLLLRLKSRSARVAFNYTGFMGSCPTIGHTLFALSTKWMSSPSRK